jgi:hypothetical protein
MTTLTRDPNWEGREGMVYETRLSRQTQLRRNGSREGNRLLHKVTDLWAEVQKLLSDGTPKPEMVDG